jgi:hypothetical protein
LTISMGVAAAGPLTPGDSAAATCWFNQTVMAVTLWTKMRADYPASVAELTHISPNASDSFAPWPYRIDVRQERQGGPGIPDCVDAYGNKDGGNLSAPGRCGCYYSNFGLDTELSASNSTMRVRSS